jgi:DNA-binding winged helix-turn-helix (wHTH) protein
MRLSFGDCLFDPDTREVFRSGKLLTVSPKAFILLEALLECRPKALSKADIHDRIWPDTFVSDANLANLVVELRAALGDRAQKPRLIRTVARYGYAFCGEAKPERGRPDEEAPPRVAYRLIWGRREIALRPGENLIGRDYEAVVWIDDESVSRRHARILIDETGARIEDLHSKNGTLVHGRKITGEARLADRDVVKIGSASMVLRALRRTGSTLSTTKERSKQ